MGITAPEPLNSEHILAEFSSGEKTLDDWLKLKALKNQAFGASRTFVVCQAQTKRVVGFYALAAGCISHNDATSNIRRNMPDPIPVIILGRLAVDCTFQKQKIGRSLVKDAFLRAVAISDSIGVRAIVVRALTDNAARFYEDFGFTASPSIPNTLFLKL